ncbi:MAG: DEAD/DEAH box helicase [Chloroflexi bacterium]|nr:DEAD/DEAH box helicase [Chloroflexota bacterium]
MTQASALTPAFVERLQALPGYRGQVAHRRRLPPRPPRHGEPASPLPRALAQALTAQGIDRLYTHQAQALDALRAGHHVSVSTDTASGKSLCYLLAVLEASLQDPASRALLLYPTKALAQDQLRALGRLAGDVSGRIRLACFDGDTPATERSGIKRSAHVVLSNPDMLHLGILPNHDGWATFFKHLRFVVLDEAHTYRGVFGSHVANVVRRLRRVCALYGSSPQFALSTATLGNAAEHGSTLLGMPVEVVADDGSPGAEKEFVFWNPPLREDGRAGRHSTNGEATFLFSQLVAQGVRTLAFAKTRRVAELIYAYARDELRRTAPQAAERISSYRAGYLPEERREIERQLFAGELLGVAATNALELGIDVGSLDATLLTGYPGSVASTWQQAGRSGRRGRYALSFLIALDDPIDQYLMHHPDLVFDRGFERALSDPANPHILAAHLLCAAYERPLAQGDAPLFGPAYERVRLALEQQGLLRPQRGRWYPATGIRYPAQEVNIRSTTSQTIDLVEEGGFLLETLPSERAPYEAHPGAVYLHRGETYLVTHLDLAGRRALLRHADLDYYTQARELTDLEVVQRLSGQTHGECQTAVGEVAVTSQVIAFKRKRQYSEEVLGEEPLDLPERRFETQALWWTVPGALCRRLEARGADLAGSLHAAEHACIGLLPLFALCDRRDIGGLSTPHHPDTAEATVFIYDGHPGGVGIAATGFQRLEELWQATLRLLRECPCDVGCPGCVHSPKCGNNNDPLDKQGAGWLLELLLAESPPPPPSAAPTPS